VGIQDESGHSGGFIGNGGKEVVTMWEFLRAFFAAKPATAEDRRRFAALVLSELKAYNEALLSGTRENPGSTSSLLEELGRAYGVYAERVGSGPEAQATFRDEAIRILGHGDARRLEPALSTALQRAARPMA
jgi:hypothetical protein